MLQCAPLWHDVTFHSHSFRINKEKKYRLHCNTETRPHVCTRCEIIVQKIRLELKFDLYKSEKVLGCAPLSLVINNVFKMNWIKHYLAQNDLCGFIYPIWFLKNANFFFPLIVNIVNFPLTSSFSQESICLENSFFKKTKKQKHISTIFTIQEQNYVLRKTRMMWC